jgi:methionyl-tRNA synthetase
MSTPTITIDDFARVEMRLGKILSVERVPETDRLLRLMVDVGEKEPRQVISGIAGYFEDPDVLVGKTCPFVCNLEHRTIRGLESQAMIVAVHTAEGAFSIFEPTLGELPPGTRLN